MSSNGEHRTRETWKLEEGIRDLQFTLIHRIKKHFLGNDYIPKKVQNEILKSKVKTEFERSVVGCI